MADEDPTAGTTPQDGGDAAVTQTTGTPDGADRNGESDERWKEALAWKSKAESYNAEREARIAAEARLAEIEARQQSPAAGRDDPGADLSRFLAESEQHAGRGDVVAGLSVVVAKELQALKRQREEDARLNADRDELREIAPDPSYRRQVAEEYLKNQHLYGSPRVAHEALQARALRQELEETRKKLAVYERKPTDVVRTDTREIPGSSHQTSTMTYDAFNSLLNSKPIVERLRLQREYREGKIQLSD